MCSNNLSQINLSQCVYDIVLDISNTESLDFSNSQAQNHHHEERAENDQRQADTETDGNQTDESEVDDNEVDENQANVSTRENGNKILLKNI